MLAFRRFVTLSGRRATGYLLAHARDFVEGVMTLLDPRNFSLLFFLSALSVCALASLFPAVPKIFFLELGWGACALLPLWRDLNNYRLRAWHPRLLFSRLLAWLLLGWPSFQVQQDLESAESWAEQAGWPGWGFWAYLLLAPIFLVWFAGEARANLRPRGSRRGGVAQRLTYVLEHYPFFWGLGFLPTCAPFLGWNPSLCFFLWLWAGTVSGDAASPNVFYIDPLEALEDWLYSAL